MKARPKKKRSSDMLATLCFAVALALLLTSAGNSLAKFYQKKTSTGVAQAAYFCFASEQLDGAYHQVSEPDGDTVFTFTVRNFIDVLRHTEKPIEYTYYAVAGSDPEGTPHIEIDAATEKQGTLSGENNSSGELSLTVAKDVFEQAGVVTVVAKATSPYTKVLTASYGFTAQVYELQSSLEEADSSVVVRFSGGDGDTVTVSWPSAALTLDQSGEVIDSESIASFTESETDENGETVDVAYQSASFTAENGVHYALTFLKTDSDTSYTLTRTSDSEYVFRLSADL